MQKDGDRSAKCIARGSAISLVIYAMVHYQRGEMGIAVVGLRIEMSCRGGLAKYVNLAQFAFRDQA